MRLLLPIGLAILLGLLYAGRLSGPFVFDDGTSILENASIRSLALPDCLIDTRPGAPTAGRPLVNFSFALNYALSRLDPFGYHLANLGIHFACGWLVYLCLARLFAAAASPERLRRHASVLAAATAVLFVVHPIGVEVVLYTSQRTEGLVSLFFLLACFAFLRHAAGQGGRAMVLLAFVATVCGALSKESIAPLLPLLLLCDRAYFAGSLGAALRRRAGMYAALLVAYVPLVAIAASTPRGVSASFWHPGYLLAQGRFVAGYLLSVFWPQLALDYGGYTPELTQGAWPFALVVLGLVLVSVVLCVTHPRLGFIGAWVFGLLAPTSSVIAIHTEVAADRRMYLPIVALLAASVAGGFAVLLWLATRRAWSGRKRQLVACACVALACGSLWVQTRLHTEAFASETLFWEHALAARPRNARAAYNLGEAHQRAGDLLAAERAYQAAIYLDRGYAEAHSNLGSLLMQRGRSDEGLFHLRHAIEISGSALSHFNYALAMRQLGRPALARAELERAIALDPSYAEAHVNLGIQLSSMGEPDRGLHHLARGVALRPQVQSLLNYAIALGQLGQLDEARAQLERALELDPRHEAARALLARVEQQLRPAHRAD